MGDLSYMLINSCPRAVGLIAANTYGQLSDSTLVEITKVWENFGWYEYNDTNPNGVYVIDKQPPSHFTPHGYTFKSNANKIFFKWGQVVMLASLDRYKAIEGRNIAWALLDETADTREEAVKTVITGRLRQMTIAVNTSKDPNAPPFVDPDHPTAGKIVNPLYIFTKPTKEQWLTEFFDMEPFREEIQLRIYSKKDFFRKTYDNRHVVIASAYHNERNLPKGYIEDRKRELSKDQIDMLIYGSPFGKSGAEYYSKFSNSVHTGHFPYIEDLPLHLTFDFNVNPYMTAQVWQILYEDRIKVRCIQEYAFESPRNTIEDVCRSFLDEYGHLTNSGFYFYGDASGRNSLPIKDVKDYFQIIERELAEIIFPSSRRILKQNPRHRTLGNGTLGRRDFMNAILSGIYGIDVEIERSCKKTISDLEFTKEDANGAKLKDKVEINGIRCEKYGHMGDAMDALICWVFGNYSREKAKRA